MSTKLNKQEFKLPNKLILIKKNDGLCINHKLDAGCYQIIYLLKYEKKTIKNTKITILNHLHNLEKRIGIPQDKLGLTIGKKLNCKYGTSTTINLPYLIGDIDCNKINDIICELYDSIYNYRVKIKKEKKEKFMNNEFPIDL